jgi:hypothetical protein
MCRDGWRVSCIVVASGRSGGVSGLLNVRWLLCVLPFFVVRSLRYMVLVFAEGKELVLRTELMPDPSTSSDTSHAGCC